MSIKIEGLENINKKLKRLETMQMLDNGTLYTIGNMVKNKIEWSFEKEADPFFNPWKPLSYNTALAQSGGKKKAYNKKGKATPKFLQTWGARGDKHILRLSGNLSMNWHIEPPIKNSVVVSNNSNYKGFAYGLTHQFGTNKAGRNRNIFIPARPFLPIDLKGRLEFKLYSSITKFLDNEIKRDFNKG